MGFEFDHIFICTDIGAIVADRIVSTGLREGSSNIHAGQGTANRRFFFQNAMLELLWVNDPEAAQLAPIARTRLWDRWKNRDRGFCPFGICLRQIAGDSFQDASCRVAFPSWEYHPPYLPETMSFAVGTNSDVLTEPMLIQTPFGRRPDRFPPEKAQPLVHPLGLREISRVELVSPNADRLSPELQAAIATDRFKLRAGSAHCLELGFDGELEEKQVDLRPELPLVLSW